jgi:hypothetical protein
MDFSDENDTDRGMAIFDHITGSIEYINWPDGPSYNKVKLSDIISNKIVVRPGARIICVTDIQVDYTEIAELKQQLTTTFDLREVVFSETLSVDSSTTDDPANAPQFTGTLDDYVAELLGTVNVEQIDTGLLVLEYAQLKGDYAGV